MIRSTIKLAVRLVVLVAAFFALGFLTVHVAGATDLRGDYRCNPLTYGRPHSCHVAPVQFVDNRYPFYGFAKSSPWGMWDTIDLRGVECVRTSPWGVIICRGGDR